MAGAAELCPTAGAGAGELRLDSPPWLAWASSAPPLAQGQRAPPQPVAMASTGKLSLAAGVGAEISASAHRHG